MHKSGVEPLVLNWNKLAMENLREEKYSESFRLLKKAEELLRYPDGTDPSKLLAITYNNFGCFYKKTDKYTLALKYLFLALDIEISSVIDKTNLAGTHLNICSVYSLMNQHQKALSHGILSTKLLKEANDIDNNLSTMTSLIISLHNTGFEYELLKDIDNSLATYKCGVDLAMKHLGPEHPITLALAKSFHNLKSKPSEKHIIKKSAKKISVTRKTKGELPIIKALSHRNRSVGSNSKLSTQVVSKEGLRTNSNKTFCEAKVMRKQLPSLGNTRTVMKRSKKIIKDTKIHGLEDKITDLQNQISLYQQKYQKLEEIALGAQLDRNRAAVVIQRYWKKYKGKGNGKATAEKKNIDNKNINKNKNKSPMVKDTLKELEFMKFQIFNDNIATDIKQKLSPVVSPRPKDSPIISFGAIRPIGLNRLQKNIALPLDIIRESKIETKEMKAILIQACIRKFLARKKFKRFREAVCKIQRNFRKYQCQGLFSSIRAAIVIIQSAWRKALVKKKLKVIL